MACPHGYPNPLSCIDCMYEGDLPANIPPKPTVVGRLTAGYDGWCRKCDTAIETGDRIARLSDETYVHDACT